MREGFTTVVTGMAQITVLFANFDSLPPPVENSGQADSIRPGVRSERTTHRPLELFMTRKSDSSMTACDVCVSESARRSRCRPSG